MLSRSLALSFLSAVVVTACGAHDTNDATTGEGAQTASNGIDSHKLSIDPRAEVPGEVDQFSYKNAFWAATLADVSYLPVAGIPKGLAEIGFDVSPNNAAGNVYALWDDAKTSTTVFYVGTNDWGVLVFRGSQQGRDWLTNLDLIRQDSIGPGMVTAHHGFNHGLDSVWDSSPGAEPPVRAFLKAHGHNLSDKKPLYIAGHSLGGALATLATYRALYDGCWGLPIKGDFDGPEHRIPWQTTVLSMGDVIKVPNPRQPASATNAPLDWGMGDDGKPLRAESCLKASIPVTALYTFGQPMVGGQNFAQVFPRRAAELKTSLFRFENGQDGVPLLPAGTPQYVHFGQPDTNHLVYLSYLGKLVRGAVEPPMSISECPFGPVADHSIFVYANKILANSKTPFSWPGQRCPSKSQPPPSDPLGILQSLKEAGGHN